MRYIPFVAMALLLGSCSGHQAKIAYPEAPSDSTTYEVFGTVVADPYRPLENDTAAATLAWVEAENEITENYLSQIPFRDKIHARLDTLNRFARRGAPWKGEDGNYYWSANDGSHNQAIIYRAATPDGEGEVFLDPNTLSDDGTVALTGIFMSKDGKHTAYTISRSGSDWTEIYVMDTASKELLPDHIEWAKFTDASWKDDGFYYSAYARPEAGKEFSNANEYHKVYYHKLGTPQSEDVVAYEDKTQPLYFHHATVGDKGNMLAVTASGQGLGNSLKVRTGNSPWVEIEPTQNFTNDVIGMVDGKVYLFTSADAPRNRFVLVDPNKPARKDWVEIIPEDPDGGVLTSVQFAGKDHFIAVFDRDASNHAYLYGIDGKKLSEIALPTYGTVGFSSDRDNEDVYYTFSSFVYPAAIYAYDLATNESIPFYQTEISGLNPDDYVTEQVFYTSSDGTKVPMFLTYKKGLERDGKNPVYLYGYGGFNITLNPGFSANRLLWLENGGI